MRNSEFIRHKPCPKCGSKDNLAEYNDHEYCFGCGYTNTFGAVHRVSSVPEPQRSPLVLPDDCEPYIPTVALDWIKQYDITQAELLNNRVLWSESRSLLVFPYFGESNQTLLGWQGRYFGDNPRHPKWFTKGYIKDFIKCINLTAAREHGIVFVEDIISAIKVGRQFGACPVFGSHIPDTHPIRLNKMGVNKFYVWLDNDKHKEARTGPFFINIKLQHNLTGFKLTTF